MAVELQAPLIRLWEGHQTLLEPLSSADNIALKLRADRQNLLLLDSWENLHERAERFE